MNMKSPVRVNWEKWFLNIFMVPLIAFLILTLMFFIAGCKKEKDQTQPAATEAAMTTSTTTTAVSTSTETQKETAAATTTAIEEETTTETEEEVPSEIQDLIDSADGYYSSGEYGLAKNTYRKAELAIKDSELSEEAQKDLIDSFYPKYNKSKEIIDTARMHFANAMQLEYEQRYDEALAELEAALKLYPKYAEAIEAYESLKAMMGLE